MFRGLNILSMYPDILAGCLHWLCRCVECLCGYLHCLHKYLHNHSGYINHVSGCLNFSFGIWLVNHSTWVFKITACTIGLTVHRLSNYPERLSVRLSMHFNTTRYLIMKPVWLPRRVTIWLDGYLGSLSKK